MDITLEQNINSTIPVVVGYWVIDQYLKEKIVGEIISNENKEGKKNNYAEVLDISIAQSYISGYDLQLHITLKTLTNLFKNRKLTILFHAKIELDRENQKFSLRDFEVDGKTKNWITDKLLESVVNKWMYEKIKNKMNFDLSPIIAEKIEGVNEILIKNMEPKEGVHVIGSLEKVEIAKLIAKEKELWIYISLLGTGVIVLEKLEF